MNNPAKDGLLSHYRWRLAQAAEIQWWRLYLAGHKRTDYLDAKRRYWRRVLERADFFPEPGEIVLDAGCGPAGIFLILREQDVVAIDPLLEAYEEKLLHFTASDYPWVSFRAMPLESFRKRATFQTAFCLNAINHVADLDLAMDRLIGSLKPGGTLLLSVDVHRHNLLKRVFRLIPGDILHPHQHALDDYRRMIEARNCRVVLVEQLKPGRIFDYYLIKAEKLDD